MAAVPEFRHKENRCQDQKQNYCQNPQLLDSGILEHLRSVAVHHIRRALVAECTASEIRCHLLHRTDQNKVCDDTAVDHQLALQFSGKYHLVFIGDPVRCQKAFDIRILQIFRSVPHALQTLIGIIVSFLVHGNKLEVFMRGA